MENRFGFKDFVLVLLVCMLIVVVLLGMKQLDRQWDRLDRIAQQNQKQTDLLASIDRRLGDAIDSGGLTRLPPTTGQAVDGANPRGDPFANIKEAEKKPDFARGDWIIDNFGTKLKSCSFPVAGDLYSQWVQARVLEGLIYRDPITLEYLPQLARDWQISDDGLTYTFKLRRGVRWSDGEPLTAEDVVFSYEFIMNKEVNCPRQRAYYEKVKGVKQVGEDTIVFTMAEPYYESLDLCGTMSVIPKHFYSKFSMQEINTNPGLLMGSGPYRLPDPKSWRPGQKMELVRNELYWGEPPTFDRCVFLEVEEEAAEETMFGNGELDVYATQPAQFERLMKDPKTLQHANHYETQSPMNGYYYIAWNQKKDGKDTLFTNPKVRRAMTLATDRVRLCHDVYLDYAKVTSGPFAMNSPQADPNIQPWPFDVSAAKKLLEEAGFADRDGSGILKNSTGEPFRFRLTYGSGNATFERAVLLMKDTYAKVGISMIPDPVDWPILQKKLDQRDFEAISLGWGGSLESDMYQEFDSSQIPDQADNFMSYVNPQLDATVREARRTVDTPKRMQLWHKAHAILHEDQPYTFLFSRMSLRFMDKRIENVFPSKVGLNYVYLFSMPDPWYVPKLMQKYKSN